MGGLFYYVNLLMASPWPVFPVSASLNSSVSFRVRTSNSQMTKRPNTVHICFSLKHGSLHNQSYALSRPAVQRHLVPRAQFCGWPGAGVITSNGASSSFLPRPLLLFRSLVSRLPLARGPHFHLPLLLVIPSSWSDLSSPLLGRSPPQK